MYHSPINYGKTLTILAIIAVWLIYASDLLIDVRVMFGSGYYLPMGELDAWRVKWAAWALLLFPCLIGGVYVLHHGLKSPVVTALLTLMFGGFCIYMHSSYYFFYATAKRYLELPDGVAKTEFLTLLNDFSAFHHHFALGFMGVMLLACAWLFVKVAMGKTIYPKRFALITPITAVALSYLSRFIGIYEAMYPLILPAFWLAVMYSVYLPYTLKHYGKTQ